MRSLASRSAIIRRRHGTQLQCGQFRYGVSVPALSYLPPTLRSSRGSFGSRQNCFNAAMLVVRNGLCIRALATHRNGLPEITPLRRLECSSNL